MTKKKAARFAPSGLPENTNGRPERIRERPSEAIDVDLR
jgi:hypothetical protein